jgi:hypothetical protein
MLRNPSKSFKGAVVGLGMAGRAIIPFLYLKTHPMLKTYPPPKGEGRSLKRVIQPRYKPGTSQIQPRNKPGPSRNTGGIMEIYGRPFGPPLEPLARAKMVSGGHFLKAFDILNNGFIEGSIPQGSRYWKILPMGLGLRAVPEPVAVRLY